jgi:capsid portal protein
VGIIPNNTGGFGDANKAAQVFDATELESLRVLMNGVNEWQGQEVVQFKPYALAVEVTSI